MKKTIIEETRGTRHEEVHSPLQLSAAFETLIERAVQAHGTPDDVEAWARRLANDVSDLTD